MNPRLPCVAVLSGLLTLGCGEKATDASTEPIPVAPPFRANLFEVVSTARYGWMELSEVDRELTPLESRLAGGVLARPTGLDIDGRGDIYVLDADYKKVAVFASDGTLRRLIAGGYGMGPGEFVEPRELAVTSDGTTYVLDWELDRVSVFDTAGAYTRSFPVQELQPNFMEISDSHLVISRFPRRSSPAQLVRINAETGAVVDSILVADSQAVDLSFGGAPGALGRARGDSLVFMPGAPGQVYIVHEAGVSEYGRNLAPEARTVTRRIGQTDVPSAPVSTRAIATLPDGRIVAMSNQKTYERGADGELRLMDSITYLDLYTSDGAYLGSATLPQDIAWGRMVVDPVGDLLFTVADDIFVGVQRMELRIIEQDG